MPEFVVIDDAELNVKSWSPGKEGESVPCTQVHVLFTIPTVATFVTRFKSREAVDWMIAALIEHRDFVWPEKK